MKQHNFCIVGLGLLGGSYAMALTAAGCRVTAVDVRPESIAFALEHGYVVQGTAQEAEIPAMLAEAEAVVLALYPQATVDWVRRWQKYFSHGAFITDVCGVKTGIVQELQGFLRPDVEFIASHPMAGREVSGVEYADASLFRAANFIITPTEKNSPEGVAFARQLAETLGFAHITQLSCAEHDRMIGYVSQLTHAIAVSLMNASDNTHLAEYTGDSFRDLTRIARINDVLWSELFLHNKQNLLEEIDAFQAALHTLRQALENENEAELRALLRQSSQRRAAFDRKR